MVAVMHNDLGFDIWCGLDVGKQAHHACALDAAGKKVFDKPLPQDQFKLEDLFTRLSEHGRVLVIVDQPNTIGALPIAVARSMGIQVAYLPGLAMRKGRRSLSGQREDRRARRVRHRRRRPNDAAHPSPGRPGRRDLGGAEGSGRVR